MFENDYYRTSDAARLWCGGNAGQPPIEAKEAGPPAYVGLDHHTIDK